MQLELLLEKMDIEEKLEMLESVWDSLYQENSEVLSPSWHKEVLEKREEVGKVLKKSYLVKTKILLS